MDYNLIIAKIRQSFIIELCNRFPPDSLPLLTAGQVLDFLTGLLWTVEFWENLGYDQVVSSKVPPYARGQDHSATRDIKLTI
jgi:hypothetical protein